MYAIIQQLSSRLPKKMGMGDLVISSFGMKKKRKTLSTKFDEGVFRPLLVGM